jgi:hypothetical protein
VFFVSKYQRKKARAVLSVIVIAVIVHRRDQDLRD